MDGSGTHCTATANYDVDLNFDRLELTESVTEDKEVKRQLISYFRSINRPNVQSHEMSFLSRLFRRFFRN